MTVCITLIVLLSNTNYDILIMIINFVCVQQFTSLSLTSVCMCVCQLHCIPTTTTSSVRDHLGLSTVY